MTKKAKRYIYWLFFLIDSFLIILLLISINLNKNTMALEEAYKVLSIAFIITLPAIIILQIKIFLYLKEK
ncbi:hypothetical protein [Persephonella sp. KM09-Lau-8]|uniref:hypothetical protein n=1 Tax=Persephonella sp. KM09-Lau-8 TaxID=1158345 RepID=UPI000497750C|nr:hypothetical protein [Persephonella sp. KM09-Lau-8]